MSYYLFKMKTNFKLLVFFGMATLTLFFVACKKSTPPTVKIHDAVSTSYTSANVTGEVTDEGTSSVTERGFIYGKQGESKQDTMFCGSGLGEFPTRLTGLEPNTTYNCFAYAKNDGSIGTSGKVTFTTRDHDLPIVTTTEVENVGITTASCGGNVMDDGGADVTERGICWGTSQAPVVSGSHATSGSGLGEYSCNMNDLAANTTYYVRAYAKNIKGVAYGEEKSFTTFNNLTVSTGSVSNITTSSATGSGNVTSDGGSTVTERGICWSTSHNPTISASHQSNGTGTGNYTVNMTSLNPNTTYYVKAYAINSQGTAYGEEVNFTTNAISEPSITTNNVTNITQTTASCGGNVTSDGGANVTARGVCWSLSQTPTVSGSHTTDGSGAGSFTSQITGLNSGKTYYVRAYATNSAGTSYGEQKTFTTSSVDLPTVTTDNVTNITQTTATSGGNVTNNGGGTITRRGIVWSTHTNPTLSDQGVNSGTGIGGFTANMTGLSPGTTYYVRAFAVNNAGIAYGAQKTFTTSSPINVPTVTTNQVTNITQNSATCGGNVVNNGGATVTARGVCWSNTNSLPTISNSHTTNGSGTGTFTSSIIGLSPETTYYVRAYATNSAGTGYGALRTFTTNSAGSWLYYGVDESWTNWGYSNGGGLEWAVMFPTTSLSPYSGTSITKVNAWVNELGTYTLRIYRGGTSSPSTQVLVQSFTVTSYGWNEFSISPLTLNTNQTLWVSLYISHEAGQYPATCSVGIGEPNARWVYWGNNGWVDAYQSGWASSDLTWMIRVYVTNYAKGSNGLEMELPQTQIQNGNNNQSKGSCSSVRR